MSARADLREASQPRRGLSRIEAAVYVGLGVTKFDELVAAGQMPKAKRFGGRVLWDIRELDMAFDAIGSEGGEVNEWNTI
jgi:predicted DNA-binding transcriptional regulator AlpA